MDLMELLALLLGSATNTRNIHPIDEAVKSYPPNTIAVFGRSTLMSDLGRCTQFMYRLQRQNDMEGWILEPTSKSPHRIICSFLRALNLPVVPRLYMTNLSNPTWEYLGCLLVRLLAQIRTFLSHL